MRSGVPRVLSVAGTDPSGGAGIQADIKSIAANGGYAMAVVTALVAQNTTGVRSVHVPPKDFLLEQLEAVSDDVDIDAIKIGMLADTTVIGVVDQWLSQLERTTVVIDPVMVATSGDRLLDPEAEKALTELLIHADLITPNVPELAVLAGLDPAKNWVEVVEQARAVSARFQVRVLAKGGHLTGPTVTDALVDGDEVVEFVSARVETRNTHGTGCSLSSAIATRHAINGDWALSLRQAGRWMNESLRLADDLHVGRGNGPISHFAGLWERGGTLAAPRPQDVAEHWWSGIEVLRADIDQLEFVSRLADGTLDSDAFDWYLAQDALYLRDYARALSVASELAPNRVEQAFWAASAHDALVGELQLHDSWLRDAAEPIASDTTQAYVDFLIGLGARGSYRELIAAVLPCYWLYRDLGRRLVSHSNPQHPYREWLDTYADPKFDQATDRAIDIVTGHAASATPEEREAMRRAFERSAEHERRFFDAPMNL